MLIDTHAHLNYEPLLNEVASVIERATQQGVRAIICPGTDLKTSYLALELSDRFNNVFPAVGIHPHDCQELPEDWEKKLQELLDNPRVVAMGEIGLDFYRDYAPEKIQTEVFIRQVKIAKERHIPLIIHNRRADKEIQSILTELKYFNGVLHCFSSHWEYAHEMLESGLFLSFTGSITYRSKKLQRVLQNVPMDRVFLETDSPFITPLPLKGFPNEPANIIWVLKKIAEVKGIDPDEVMRITGENAKAFFQLPL